MPSMLRSRVVAAISAARRDMSACGRFDPARVLTSSMTISRLLRGRFRLDGIPPRADAGHDLVIAFDHLDWATIAVFGVFQAERAGLGAVLFRQPGPIMAPHARPFLALECLPFVDVDCAGAPA